MKPTLPSVLDQEGTSQTSLAFDLDAYVPGLVTQVPATCLWLTSKDFISRMYTPYHSRI